MYIYIYIYLESLSQIKKTNKLDDAFLEFSFISFESLENMQFSLVRTILSFDYPYFHF